MRSRIHFPYPARYAARVTEPGGQIGAVRRLPGVAPELVEALVRSLADIDARCAALAERLETGAVHEHAFGKLVDAAKVRDAYHDRLPKARENLAEAATVAREFLAEFSASPIGQGGAAGAGAAQGADSAEQATVLTEQATVLTEQAAEPTVPDDAAAPTEPRERAEPAAAVPAQREPQE
jgi:hypothetical protein